MVERAAALGEVVDPDEPLTSVGYEEDTIRRAVGDADICTLARAQRFYGRREIKDVLAYLQSSIELEHQDDLVVDIGTAPLSFQEMMQQAAVEQVEQS